MFYYNIFSTKKSFIISVIVVMIIVWLWAISVVLETLLLCRPLAYNWDTSTDGECGERNATFVVAGTLNLVTNLMVMVLPLPHIWKLKLNLAKKLALTAVFCMGLLVSVISIVRLMALMAIDFNDITYTLPMGVLWTVLEPQLAIVCANMPVLKPILSRMFPRLFGSTNQKSYGVSDPQAFERLDERGYSLGKVSRNPLDTHVSGGERQPAMPFSNTFTYLPSHLNNEQRAVGCAWDDKLTEYAVQLFSPVVSHRQAEAPEPRRVIFGRQQR
ncbi:hypothetical protein AN8328.2 [Aspergillus nidulans FGSC A4]|uniref:Rhodopsin domain-containing protein n=1 Tax=Emericella nidulans (strain FGSC A4 / ATCC 38163 / CBS 112.46 / NRRL 194 / M139) TaxID=227321 RepID=Q5ATQ2_EMENI|nr:hypothetical protein [Aspergillus nidulans FGSC A4]EAA66951.1 hypothetical protein AN8328.2 [Aspergillus nidulans FGSC A4]CBF80316.1 TPA: conserved hypothetical protein [Aspergillus nidulans FGSC A4]|eukprot:XP_681597.1 hypothetical protein AN8328.2 [Aspergillus nidulans FGSC A4]